MNSLARTLDVLIQPNAPWSVLIVGDHPHVLSRCHEVARLEHGTIAVEAHEISA